MVKCYKVQSTWNTWCTLWYIFTFIMDNQMHINLVQVLTIDMLNGWLKKQIKSVDLYFYYNYFSAFLYSKSEQSHTCPVNKFIYFYVELSHKLIIITLYINVPGIHANNCGTGTFCCSRQYTWFWSGLLFFCLSISINNLFTNKNINYQTFGRWSEYTEKTNKNTCDLSVYHFFLFITDLGINFSF